MLKQYISILVQRIRTFLDALPLNQKLVVIGTIVGIAAGVSSYVLVSLIHFLLDITVHRTSSWFTNKLIMLFLPALGGLITGAITHFYCKEAGGHATEKVIHSITHANGIISGRVAIAKTISSAVTIASGGSAGHEGPIIQIGASVGSALGQFINVSISDLKVLVAAGAAGGLASTFNIPLAGVFFTMEVILKDFANAAFPAVVISSVSASIVARFLLGHEGFLPQLTYSWNNIDIIFYIIWGFICIFIGHIYIVSLQIATKKMSNTKFYKLDFLPSWTTPMLGGLCVGLISLFFPQIIGTGHHVIFQVLMNEKVGWSLLILAIMKLIATCFTLGSGGSGGSLMPALFIGATAGAAYGNLLSIICKINVNPGAFAIAGMAGVFSSAFQAPVTSMIMIFEMTQDYGLILPVMIVCMISFLFSKNKFLHNKNSTSKNPLIIEYKKSF